MVEPSGPILEGSSVSLLCKSRSNPPVSNYTWYRGDEVDTETGPTVVIDDVDPSHSGDYRCSVKNDLGEHTSAKIQLDIQCEFIKQQTCLYAVMNVCLLYVQLYSPKQDLEPRLLHMAAL